MVATAFMDCRTPLEPDAGEQGSRQSRNSRTYAMFPAFVLGMMVATMGLLTAQHYGLSDASFTKFFFARPSFAGPSRPTFGTFVPAVRSSHGVLLVQPVVGATGTSVAAQLSNKKALNPRVPQLRTYESPRTDKAVPMPQGLQLQRRDANAAFAALDLKKLPSNDPKNSTFRMHRFALNVFMGFLTVSIGLTALFATIRKCGHRVVVTSTSNPNGAELQPADAGASGVQQNSGQRVQPIAMSATSQKWQSYRWEGDSTSRPLGQMERLLNARRSWSGAMTTAHVAAAILNGPPPTESELLKGLEWILRRHPLLASCVRGKSNHYVPNAQPYPMHSNYLDRAFYYNKELFKPEPDKDLQRFEPSPLSFAELARRALIMSKLPVSADSDALTVKWQQGFAEAMDASCFDEDGDGPLWRMTLYVEEGKAGESVLLYQANHAISDQLSFNLMLSEVLTNIAAQRAGLNPENPAPLPLPPSVEGALLGKEQRQGEDIKTRLELIIGSFVEGVRLPTRIGGTEVPSWLPKALPGWKVGRIRLATVQYGLWQAAASGMKVLPRWIAKDDSMVRDESKWEHRARRTRNIFRSIDVETTSRLVNACRARNTTVGSALCAAAVLGSSDVMGTKDDPEQPQTQRYKLLQALNLRTLAFEAGQMDQTGARDDWSNGGVLAGTGSLDIVLDLPPQSGELVRSGSFDLFWSTAIDCNNQTKKWISSGWGRESLLLFSAGWEFMNMNRVVELGSQDRSTLGRAFSAGISNAGKYAHATKYGDLQLSRLHFGISQSVSGAAISTSAVTIDGELCLTISYATPIWSTEAAEEYADNIVKTLEIIIAQT